ncbi:MAG: hypothetical protein DI538_04700 [Azospira oryzae]|jgi:hypothetical protein|nr:MAG: hypothetical protein DI538_04700 [Azospira oryzae]
MKKIIAITSIVLFSTAMFAGGAEESPKSSSGIAVMQNAENGLFKVYYKAAEAANVKVSILNDENQEVFTETIRKVNGFVRPYNFQNLKEGEYTIRIDDGTQSQAEKVVYQSGKLEKLIQVRKMKSDEGKYLLTASGQGKEQITVNIYDSTDKIIYTELQQINDTFAQVYNLSQVKGGIAFEIIHANGTAQRLQY